MSIQVTCPNGHRLKVKDHWAGRTGKCPKCHASITVPEAPAVISDDDALAMIGEFDGPPPIPSREQKSSSDEEKPRDEESNDDQHVLDEYEAQLELATSGLSLLGSGVQSVKRVCKKCGKITSQWSASCAHCGTYFDDGG